MRYSHSIHDYLGTNVDLEINVGKMVCLIVFREEMNFGITLMLSLYHPISSNCIKNNFIFLGF
ncbi:MAG: hypothetical protein QG670_667 [Thermoproteota archaeon]|nr:hypothetical protein [Thermoproteota archaeon]